MAQEINENNEAQQIHHQMAETRLALSEKVGALQDRMKDTVDTTRETVEDALHSVKQSVQDTLQSVKSAFDIRKQTQKHPWCMLGSSVFLGVFLSHLTGRRTSWSDDAKTREAESASLGDTASAWSAAASSRPRVDAVPESSAGPSLKQRLASQFQEEIAKVQRVAIGVTAGIFRDWIKKAMPSIATKLEDVIDSATSKMGGEPIRGPVFRQGHNGHNEHEG